MKKVLFLMLLGCIGLFFIECNKNKKGCTNEKAINFNPESSEDDGSCIIPGCMNQQAINYDPEATQDDGSCTFNDSTSYVGFYTNKPKWDGDSLKVYRDGDEHTGIYVGAILHHTSVPATCEDTSVLRVLLPAVENPPGTPRRMKIVVVAARNRETVFDKTIENHLGVCDMIWIDRQ